MGILLKFDITFKQTQFHAKRPTFPAKGGSTLTFLTSLAQIGLPIAIQNLISSCLGLVDVFMIGTLSEEAIAGVGIANQFFITFAFITFGISNACSIYVSQHFGKGNRQGAVDTVKMALFLGLAFGLPFSIITCLFAHPIMSLLSPDIAVVTESARYLRIIAPSFVPFTFTCILVAGLRGVLRTKPPLFASIVGLFSNFTLNYLLIFGNCGFPKLGVEGAAIATVTSRLIEFSIILTVASKSDIRFPVSQFLQFSRPNLRQFAAKCNHMVLADWLRALGITVYSIAYAYAGSDLMTAVQITNSIQNILFGIMGGVCMATSILIGTRLGNDDFETAYQYAKNAIKVSIVCGFFSFFALIASLPLIFNVMSLSAGTQNLVTQVVFLYACYLPIRFQNYILAIGILRSGGDTKYCMILEILVVWGIAVPAAFIGVFLLKLPVFLVILFVNTEELAKITFFYRRFRKRKWLVNCTKQNQTQHP